MASDSLIVSSEDGSARVTASWDSVSYWNQFVVPTKGDPYYTGTLEGGFLALRNGDRTGPRGEAHSETVDAGRQPSQFPRLLLTVVGYRQLRTLELKA